MFNREAGERPYSTAEAAEEALTQGRCAAAASLTGSF